MSRNNKRNEILTNNDYIYELAPIRQVTKNFKIY